MDWADALGSHPVGRVLPSIPWNPAKETLPGDGALRLVVTCVSPEDPWTSPAQEMTILQRSLLPSLACLAPPKAE